jgi:hypothetical protein
VSEIDSGDGKHHDSESTSNKSHEGSPHNRDSDQTRSTKLIALNINCSKRENIKVQIKEENK